MSFAVTPARLYRASDEFAREVVGRLRRAAGVLLGLVIVAAGVLIAPLPGPGGLPVIVVGVMIVLRNSYKARRQFVKLQRAHPKMVFPIRRLLRRDPEILPVFWQQTLRVERLMLPRRRRVLVRWRKRGARRSPLNGS